MILTFRRVCVETRNRSGAIVFGSYDLGEKVYNLFENEILPKLQEKYENIKYYDYFFEKEV